MAEYQLIFMRSLFAFIILLIICRILGKQQISQLTFFDYIVGITIGSIASSLSVDQNIKITNGLMSLIVWGGLPVIIAFLSIKSRAMAMFFAGTPMILIENGKINEKNLRKSKLTLDQLMLNLRQKNVFKLSDVELAVFETNGEVSVMKKTDQQPITPKVLGMQLEADRRPYLLIQDGKVIEKQLQQSGYTKEWLFGEIQKQGAQEFKDVFVAQVDSKGNLYVDLYDDQKTPQASSARPLVAAQLHKILADLNAYALSTENEEAKRMYREQYEKMKALERRVAPFLK